MESLFLASIVEYSDDAIIGKGLDGSILSWNTGAQKMYGFSAEEAIGQSILIVVPPDRQDEVPNILDRISKGETVEHYETKRMAKNGQQIHVSVTVSPIKNQAGEIIGASSVARDIGDRKRADEALQRASAYSRSLIEASLDPLVTVSAEGKVTDVNFATERVTGLSRNELIGTDFVYYFTDPEKAREVYQQAFRDGSVRDYELEIRHKNGMLTPVMYNASVYRDESGQMIGLFAAARDITESKRAEKALHAASAYNRSLIEASLDPLVTISAEGEITDVNIGTERVTGYSRNELIGTDFVYYFTDPEKAREVYQQAFRDGSVRDYELEIRHKNGMLTPVMYNASVYRDESGQMIGLFAAARDITESKRSVEALRRLNRQLQAISNCNQVLLRALDEQALVKDICRIICDEAGYRLAWVGYAENDDAKTIGPVAWAGFDSGYIANAQLSWADDTERGRGPAGTAIRSGETVCVQDFVTDPRFAPWRESALQRGYRSGIVLPLKDESAKVFGGLMLYHAEPNVTTSDEIQLMEELAGNLAFGINALRARAERKSAEERLRLLDFALDHVSEAAFLIDQNARLRFVNEGACHALGYTRPELLGLSVSDLDPDFPNDTTWNSHWNNLKAQGSLTLEGRHKTRDGRIFPVEINANYFEYGGQGYNLGFVRDITDRKRAEEALRRSEAYLVATQRLSNTGSWVWDPINRKILYWSEELFRMLGFDPQQGFPTPDQVLERIHPEDVDKVKYARMLPEKVDFDFEARIVLPDGTIKHLHALAHPVLNPDGDLIEVIACVVDITDRKRAEVALRVSEERFRAVFEGARDMILIKDHSLRYTHVNGAGERKLGLPASEIIGRTAEDLFEKEAVAYIRDVDERVLQGEVVEGEYVRKFRGVPRAFSVVQVPLRDDAGVIIGICGIARDITDRRNIGQAWTKPLSDHYPSPAMHKALREARYASATESIVLLQGESGSGKDYLARWIHDQSKRSGGPYFAVNCAAIPKELAESELFGHEAGAFTGAISRKRGLLELAEGGTLLLNEIGELPLSLQSKLLTFLDTKSLLRVGGDKSIHINARLIAATHRNLETEVAEGRFMAPLFYRLNVFTIQVPPLRDRIEDIPVLAEEILLALGAELQLSQTPSIDLAQMNKLMRYNWSGNVRELRNVLERSLMLACGDRLDIVLPVESQCSDDWEHTILFTPGRSLQDVTDEVTHSLCEYVLRRSGGSRQETARLLEISRTALYRHMKRLRITNDNETGN